MGLCRAAPFTRSCHENSQRRNCLQRNATLPVCTREGLITRSGSSKRLPLVSAGGPRMDRRAVTSLGVVKI